MPNVLEKSIRSALKAPLKATPKQLLKSSVAQVGQDAWKATPATMKAIEEAARKMGRAPMQGIAAPHGHVPPQSMFETIKGWVKSLLPDTTSASGLPHQHFWFQEDQASGGKLIRVDNDLKFGSRVPLKAGDQLTIKGVPWHDPPAHGLPAMDGIHWTHKADPFGPGGFIQTIDGKIFN